MEIRRLHWLLGVKEDTLEDAGSEGVRVDSRFFYYFLLSLLFKRKLGFFALSRSRGSSSSILLGTTNFSSASSLARYSFAVVFLSQEDVIRYASRTLHQAHSPLQTRRMSTPIHQTLPPLPPLRILQTSTPIRQSYPGSLQRLRFSRW